MTYSVSAGMYKAQEIINLRDPGYTTGNVVQVEIKGQDRGKTRPQGRIRLEIGEVTKDSKMTDEDRITGKASRGTKEISRAKDSNTGDLRKSKFR